MRPLLLIFLIILFSCAPEEEVYFGEQEVEGYKPIYADPLEANSIEILESQPIEAAGKLFLYNNLLLINEIGKGIHIIDNTFPAAPLRLGFIKIPGNHDMVMKGNIVYANNYADLIAIKIISPDEIEVTQRIKDVIPSNALYPTERDNYFECVDASKGKVIGWQKTLLINPECYR